MECREFYGWYCQVVTQIAKYSQIISKYVILKVSRHPMTSVTGARAENNNIKNYSFTVYGLQHTIYSLQYDISRQIHNNFGKEYVIIIVRSIIILYYIRFIDHS